MSRANAADGYAISSPGELPRLRSLCFTVHGQPVPKARARKGKGNHWHTPKRTADYESTIAWHARAARMKFDMITFAEKQPPWPLNARYRIECAIYLGNERRADCDNILKAVGDAMNGGIYLDDSQVIETATIKRIDRENPRIDVRVYVLATEGT